MKTKELGLCQICDREMVAGPSVNDHHLVPKSLGGKETLTIHRICHQKIHSLFTERELEKKYNTVNELKAHPEMEKFIRWLRNKPATFYDRNDKKAK